MFNLHAESISAERNSDVVDTSGDQIYSLEKYWIKNSSNKNIVFECKKCIKYTEYKFVNKLNENVFWYHEKVI